VVERHEDEDVPNRGAYHPHIGHRATHRPALKPRWGSQRGAMTRGERGFGHRHRARINRSGNLF